MVHFDTLDNLEMLVLISKHSFLFLIDTFKKGLTKLEIKLLNLSDSQQTSKFLEEKIETRLKQGRAGEGMLFCQLLSHF